MATGRQVTYTLQLNSNVSAILNQADKDSNKFNSSMWELQKTLSSFGLGLGAHFLIDGAKEWAQGAADYEQAMLRIKNASSSFGQGINNQSFINKEVDNLKLKLDEGVEAYGNYLFKIKNANLASSVENRMYDNILTISKVGGLSQHEMDASIRNTATMLGEGVLEARHLRGLSYTHPQIVPFIADELGLKDNERTKFTKLMKVKSEEDVENETKSQQLSKFISSGKLTKAGISANVIIGAWEKLRLSVEDKLPETLKTVQSEINALDTAWFRFKKNLTLDNKEELVGFFHSLTESIHFLVDHEDDIVRGATAIANLVKMYAEWRLAIFALQAPAALIGFVANEQERLVNVFSVYGDKANEIAAVNNELAVSQQLLNEEIVGSDTLAEMQVSAIEGQLVALEELKSALTEVSIQTDLFTDAQLINHSSFQRIFYDTELLNGELHRLQIGLEKNSYQGSLFTDSELEMSAATKTNSEALAIQNEQLALTNQLLAENADIASISAGAWALQPNMGGALGNINGKIGSGIGGLAGGLTSGLMDVFIVGMALEVAESFFPQGKISKTAVGIRDVVEVAATIFSPANWKSYGFGTGYGFEKIKKIAEENYDAENLQHKLITSSMIDKGKLKEDGHLLYTLISHSPLFDQLDPKDKFGKRVEDNAHLYDLLKRNFDLSPYTIIPNAEPGKSDGSTTGKNSSALGKDTHHLKGNSSNYFTVNIHEMNGVKQYTVKTDSTGFEMTEKNVEQMIGDGIIKALTDAVNDSQLLSNNHH